MFPPSESIKRLPITNNLNLPLHHFINNLKVLLQIHLTEIRIEIVVEVLVTLVIIVLTLDLLVLALVHTLTIEITNTLIKMITILTNITPLLF